MLKCLFALMLLFGSFPLAFGQGSESKRNYVPSPEAYSLMQYEAIPVSKYTGVPSISIPIYTIQVGDHSLPISLNYHASGIKITQEASWVGLGWSLSAGGIISRSICGKDDIYNYSVKTSPVPIVKYLSKDSANIKIEGDVYDETNSTVESIEPDVFQYNFDGYSGKFYFRKGAMKNKLRNKFIVSNPEQNLRIETDDIWSGFVVTTPGNVKYIFKDGSKVQSAAQVYNHNSSPSINSDPLPTLGEPTLITSWYLSRIEYPTKDTIHFDYTYENNAYLSPLYLSEQYVEIRDSKIFTNDPNAENYFYSRMPATGGKVFTSMHYTAVQPRIKAIRWKNGRLAFVPSAVNRRDIRSHPYKGGEGPRSLTAIEIYRQEASEPLQTVSFHYSYFLGKDASGRVITQPNFLSARLRLCSIMIKGTGTTGQKYEMEYDEEPLPQKNSHSCDAWGYYNGSDPWIPYFPVVAQHDYHKYQYSNNGLVQSDILIKQGDKFSLYPDEDKLPTELAKAAVLTALVSPTGGRTEFKYENNRVLDGMDWTVDNSYPEKTVSYTKEANEDIKTFTLDMPYRGYVEFYCVYKNTEGNNTSLTKEKSTPIITFSNYWTHWGIPATESQNKSALPQECYDFKKRMPCAKGTYQVTVRTKERASLDVIVRMREATYKAREKLVGGLRIAEIKSPVSTKKFTYTDCSNLSSGQLNREPQFSIIKLDAVYGWGAGTPGALFGYYTSLEYHSNTVVPLENPYNSYFMGYTEVTTSEFYRNENIVEKDFFYNERERKPHGKEDPGVMMPMNGRLMEHRIYSDGTVLKQRTINQYEYQLLDHILGFKVTKGYNPYNYQINEYHIAPSVVLDTLYATVSGQSIRYPKKTEYLYNSTNFRVRQENTTEGGTTRQHNIYYTVDYANSYYADAVNKYNYVSTPVEEEFLVNSKQEKKFCHIHYQNEALSPWKEFVFQGEKLFMDNPYFDGEHSLDGQKPEVTYLTYDKYGRNTSFCTRMGQTTTLIWGYHHQYVIAQISNATLAEVQQAGIDPDVIGDKAEPSETDWNLLHSLRTRLPRSSVVVARYEPLVGIVCRTDPRGVTTRYTYDEFSRLKEIIENENGEEHILQRMEYKYANEK